MTNDNEKIEIKDNFLVLKNYYENHLHFGRYVYYENLKVNLRNTNTYNLSTSDFELTFNKTTTELPTKIYKKYRFFKYELTSQKDEWTLETWSGTNININMNNGSVLSLHHKEELLKTENKVLITKNLEKMQYQIKKIDDLILKSISIGIVTLFTLIAFSHIL